MADFNLSAEIALQLAKNTIVNLKTEIQKAFSGAALEIDADKTLSAAQKKAYKKTITVPAILDFGDIKTETKDIESKLKPVKISVAFNKASVRSELTNSKLQEALGARQIVVRVGVQFSAEADRKLKELSRLKSIGDKAVKEDIKINKSMSAADKRQAEKKSRSFFENLRADASNATSAIDVTSKKSKKATQDVNDLISRLRQLSSEISRSRMTSGPIEATFFEGAIDDVNQLIRLLGNGNLEKGVEELQKRFAGLNNSSFSNLESALKSLYKANADLDNQERRLRGTNKPLSDIQPQLNMISLARRNLVKIFESFDAVDPFAFGTRIREALSGVNESINRFVNTATADVNKFVDLINSLNAAKERVRATGGSAEAIDLVQKQIDIVEKIRAQGGSLRDVRANDQFQINSGVLKNLGYVDITLSRIRNTFASLERKASGDLSKTVGGRVTRLRSQADEIRKKANAELSSLNTNDPLKGEKAQNIRNKSVEQINTLISRADKLNQKYASLKALEESFKANGFEKSAQAVRNLNAQFLQAARSGKGLESLGQQIDASLAQITNFKGVENKVNGVIRQLERLKITLGREADGDITGVIQQIDALEQKIKGRLNNVQSPLGIDELNQISTKGIFDIRQGEKINRYVENTAHKLRILGDAQDDLAVEAKYDLWANKFEYAAKKIASSSSSVTSKMNQLKKLSDETFVKARFDADGGFFGTVSKAAGLAAKRLGAFLILAQGLYGIQAQISQSISDAVKIDKEFVRLEQVITGGLSGAELERSYKDLDALKKQILFLGKAFGIATTEIAGSAQVLAQAGLQGKDLAKILDVVAKSQLGPSFASANETAEAAIAIMNQFRLTAEQTANALGGVNRLSAKYAAEAQGITEAVRRAGGVFATAGGNIGEFSAAFTIIKEQTREADESIATALRNITQRIQRSSVQKYLRETLNIELVDNGQFIGFEQAIIKIGKAIKDAGISENSPLFSEIREKLAGTLQAGRITPLLQNYEELIKYSEEFAKGSKSIEEDVVIAFNSIENKIQRAKSSVVELFTEIGNNDAVKFLIEGFTQLTVVITNMLRALNSLPGAILAIGAAFKAVTPFKGVVQAILSQFNPRGINLVKKNSGGKVPGVGPDKDSVLAHLTPGEFVIRRSAVNAYGVDFLNAINKKTLPRNQGGIIPGAASFNNGGLVEKLLSAGFKISQNVLNKYVKNFKVGNFADPLKRGSANVRNKSIQVTEGASLSVLAHEFGHIITAQLDKSELLSILQKLPSELISSTINRMSRSPNAYGKVGSDKFNSKFNSELAADAVTALSRRARGDKKYAGDKALNDLADAIERSTGVSMRSGIRPLAEPGGNAKVVKKSTVSSGSNTSGGVRPLTDPQNIQRTKSRSLSRGRNKSLDEYAYRFLTEPSDRGPKDQRMGPRGSQTLSLKDKFIPTAPRGLKTYSTGSNNILGPLSIVEKNGSGIGGGNGGGSGGGNGPRNPDSPNNFPWMNSLKNSTINAAKGMKGFDFSIFSSKKAIIALIGSLLAMQATIGGVNAELGNLVSAAISGAAAFSVIGKLGSIISFAKSGAEKVSGLGKFGKIAGVKSGKIKASDLAQSAIDQRKVFPSLPFSDRLSRVKNRQLLIKDKLSLDSGAASKTEDILSKVRSAKPVGPAGLKNISSLGKIGGLVKNLNAISIGFGILTSALSYFTSSVEEAGIAALANAKNQEDAIKAAESARAGKVYGSAVSKAGTVGGFALGGASIGAALGGVGAIPGAIIGAITGAIVAFSPKLKSAAYSKFKGVIDSISPYFQMIKEGIGFVFTSISDSIYSFTYEEEALKANKSNAALVGRQNFTKGRLQRASERVGSGGNSLNNSELGDVLSSVQVAQGIIDKTPGGVDKVDPEVLAAQKEALQRVSEIYSALPDSERAKVLDAAKRTGVDMTKLFASMGVSLIDVKAQAAIAFEKFSTFLSLLKNSVEFSSARLSGIEAGMDFISNPSQQSFVPSQVFDIIAAGFEPNKLGLTQFSSALGNLENQVINFDKTLYDAAKLQIQGQRAVRGLKGAVSSGAIANIKFDSKGNKEESLRSTLTDAFSISSGGNELLNASFDKFIEGKIDQMGDAFGDNQILSTKINEWLDEFAAGLDQGALDQIRRINEINKNFASQYDSIMKERFSKEGEIIDLFKSNVDKQKSIYDLQNKANGLSGDNLSRAQRVQSVRLDNAKLGASLTGTGLSGNATPQEMQAALLQSQARSQNAGAIVRQRGLTGASAVTAEAEIRAVEEERQKRLQAGLQYIANGTEQATYAMQEFERASQKAAASSKFLTDTLLGTDDQIIDTYKGIAAFQAIRSAKSPEQAQSLLVNMDEQQRSALNNYLSQNESARSTFEQKVGFGSSIAGSPEAKAAEDQLRLQQDANNALAAGISNSIQPLLQSTNDLKEFYKMQFENTRAIVNEANNAAKNLVNQIAQLPNVITHEGNINVNLVGANQLQALQEGIRGFVQQQINVALANNNQALKENNQGISIPSAAGRSFANAIIPGAGNLL